MSVDTNPSKKRYPRVRPDNTRINVGQQGDKIYVIEEGPRKGEEVVVLDRYGEFDTRSVGERIFGPLPS